MSRVTTEIVTNYIPNEDITVVWQLLYIDGENIQRTTVGWYHGEPDEKSTKDFSHLGVMGQYLFDDLIIPEAEKPKNFKVLNYAYLNTGGNMMVGIFTVWLPDKNRTAYVLANEEGANLTSVDYISNEVDIEDYDELILDHCVYEFLHGDEEYFELWRYCLNEYTKSDCRYFGCTRAIPYRLLSNELQSKIDADYLAWLESNNYDVLTDGEIITEHPDYAYRFNDAELNAIKDFREWHNLLVGSATEDELTEMYNKKYHLYFNGKRVHLPFTAETFNTIQDLLNSVIKEW